MKLKNELSVLLLLLVAGVMMSCAGQRAAVNDRPEERLVVPAGVDSAVAMHADTLAKKLFVPWPEQQRARARADTARARVEQANALWQALLGQRDRSQITPEDTLMAVRKFNEGGRNLKEAGRLQKGANANSARVRQRVVALLESARKSFEEAIILNPFDRNTRLWLGNVYQLLAKHNLARSNLEKAAEIFENLVRLDRSKPFLYAKLAETYMSLKQWDRALANFRRAEQVLRVTAPFNVPDSQPLNPKTVASALDSANLFLYVYYQGDANIRMYRADSALFHLERALPLARKAEDREAVVRTIGWINWDDGNIRASELRDSLATLVDEKKYATAAQGYEYLTSILRTGRARREIQWRLALLEFSSLNKEEQALRRMKRVVDYYRNALNAHGDPADSLKNAFYKDYGTMCYNRGLYAAKQNKMRVAFAYFQQAAAVPWPQRAKSYLQIAKLSINSPKQAVAAAKAALEDRDQLTTEEVLATLEIMTESLKKVGLFDEAKKFYLEAREIKARAQKNGTARR